MQGLLPLPPEAYRLTDPRGREVLFTITRSRRRTWTVYVHGNGSVEVRVPTWMSDDEARRHAAEHAPWVFRQLDRLARRPHPPAPLRFADGEKVRYLGGHLVLRLRPGLPVRADLDEAAGELRLTLPPPADNPVLIKRLLLDWYARRASALFPARVERCLEHARAERFPPLTRLTIRHARSRWGSCSAQGHVMLNAMLVQAPPECTDYVVLHELCHLREMNHSRRFYAILTRLMPNWKVYSEKLDAIPIEL